LTGLTFRTFSNVLSVCVTLSITGDAYSGHHPPLRDIRQGINEGYQAKPGYDQATGLGVLDVANLAAFFK
jgi:hypothetical protein